MHLPSKPRSRIRCLAGTVAFAAAWLAIAFAKSDDKPRRCEPGRFALLVGVDDYSNLKKLQFCGNDSRALRDQLVSAGFPADQVVLMHDDAKENRFRPFKANIERQLALLLNEVEADDLVVVAFSGHGVQPGETAYFCPADGNIDDAQTLIPLTGKQGVYDQLQKSKAALKLVIVDACRDDLRIAGKGGSRDAEDVARFVREPPPPGIVCLRSCGPGQKSQADPQLKHGVFMHYVLEGFSGKADGNGDGFVSVDELSTYAAQETKKHVRLQFNDYQSPDLKGDFDIEVRDFRLARAVAAVGKALTNSIGMELVLIPAGKFRMGSPASEKDRDDDEAQVDVTLTKAFYLGKTEVTQGQWRAVMGTTPWKGKDYVREGDRYAATFVSWEDASNFCKKLAAKDNAPYRLPTEAEWEYACRGGQMTRFSFGDDDSQLGDYAWWGGFEGDGNAKNEWYAHEVRLKRPNPLGLFDMHGNVWEWCQDVHDKQLPGGTDPLVSTGSGRVFRGGSWFNDATTCRAANRGGLDPSSRSNSLGFRVAWSPSGNK